MGAKRPDQGGEQVVPSPGQPLGPEDKKSKVDVNATDETIEKLKAKAKQHGLLIVNFGVVGIPKDEAGARKVFEFAKTLGVRAITIESLEEIDVLLDMASLAGRHQGLMLRLAADETGRSTEGTPIISAAGAAKFARINDLTLSDQGGTGLAMCHAEVLDGVQPLLPRDGSHDDGHRPDCVHPDLAGGLGARGAGNGRQ